MSMDGIGWEDWPMTEECYSCRQETDLANLPIRERIYLDEQWRLVHAFNSALPGWLVLVPRRHVLAIADLNAEEAAGLGPLLVRVSQVLGAVTGCAKTYAMQFAESAGFEHVHVHVVPRMPDLPQPYRGPGIAHYLTRPAVERMTAQDQDSLAEKIASRL
jgi:diadenosine tetraphosphate (Ap4A) HIT family hydrolase